MVAGVMSASLPRLTRFADGITAVDTEYVRPQMDASHVVVAIVFSAIKIVPSLTLAFEHFLSLFVASWVRNES